MVDKNIRYKAIAINPFDNWVFGSLIILKDSTTEEVTVYIQSLSGEKVRIEEKTICRFIRSEGGIDFYANDIIEFDDHSGLPAMPSVRRIEPILDTGLTVFVGRSQNEYAYRFFGDQYVVRDLNCKVVGNLFENPDLLEKKWVEIKK